MSAQEFQIKYTFYDPLSTGSSVCRDTPDWSIAAAHIAVLNGITKYDITGVAYDDTNTPYVTIWYQPSDTTWKCHITIKLEVTLELDNGIKLALPFSMFNEYNG